MASPIRTVQYCSLLRSKKHATKLETFLEGLSIVDMPDIPFEDLLEMGCHAWFGQSEPPGTTRVDFLLGTNNRVSSSLHGQYDAVWLVEDCVFDHPDQWKCILDESTRLLKEHGQLIVQASAQYVTGYYYRAANPLVELKNLLGRAASLEVELESQVTLEDGSQVCVFSIHRLDFRHYSARDWTFAILSDGRKAENVKALILEAESQRGDLDVEYLVLGPEFDCSGLPSIRFLQPKRDDRIPRVGEKKALAVEAAQSSNVAIFHDRFQIDPGFFEGFEAYGYDFDYLTVSQKFESGAFYPAYIGLPQKLLRIQPINFTEKYDKSWDGQFINGGLIVFKRVTARKVNFNSLLLHGEAEDVELSFSLADRGIVPRINFISSATTIGTPESTTATFTNLTNDVTVSAPEPPSTTSTESEPPSRLIRIWNHIPEETRARIKRSRIFAKIRRMLSG